MVLTISTTKFFLGEISFGDYNFHRWTSKPTEYYFVNSKQTCKPPELHTIMKKSNGTGLVLKICETKNNVWKKHELSILNGIDNYIKIIKIKLDSALMDDGDWHKTAEIAENLGLKDTRTKELLKELVGLEKLVDNGKTKGKMYKLK